MRVTLLQFAPAWEDRAATKAKIASMLAGYEIGDWLVLPEMALSGFSMDRAKTEWDESDFSFFADLSRKSRCRVTVGGCEDGENKAFLFKDGELALGYAKRHLFSFASEDRHYSPGESATTYDIRGLRVSQSICYDLRFPYLFWGQARDTDCYCVIAAWGGKRAEHWKTLLRARAIENQAYVVGVNRVGEEPSVGYSGDSAVIDPRGRAVIDCGSAEGAFSAEIDPSAVGAWRAEFPVLEDRRE